jgi:hypothetical protein
MVHAEMAADACGFVELQLSNPIVADFGQPWRTTVTSHFFHPQVVSSTRLKYTEDGEARSLNTSQRHLCSWWMPSQAYCETALTNHANSAAQAQAMVLST